VESDDDAQSESEHEVAPKKRRAPNGKAKAPPKKRVKEESDASDEEDAKTFKKKNATSSRTRAVKNESDDEDSKPLKKAAAKPRATKKVKKDEGSGSDTPKPKKRSAKAKEEEAAGSASPAKGKAKKGKKKEEEEEEDVFKWWEQHEAQGDGTERWQTLEHYGVLFPPPYVPLPSNVKMKYDGMCTHLFLPLLHSHLNRRGFGPSARRGGSGWLLRGYARNGPRPRCHLQ
jgi:DNA topoisomerase-1